MQVSVRLAALPISEYLDFHSGYSAPRSRIAGTYSRIYSYTRIFPNERAPSLAVEKQASGVPPPKERAFEEIQDVTDIELK